MAAGQRSAAVSVARLYALRSRLATDRLETRFLFYPPQRVADVNLEVR